MTCAQPADQGRLQRRVQQRRVQQRRVQQFGSLVTIGAILWTYLHLNAAIACSGQQADWGIEGATQVSVDGNELQITLAAAPAMQELVIPRLANVVERIFWLSPEQDAAADPISDLRAAAATMTLSPDITSWKIRLSKQPPQYPATLVISTDGVPMLFGPGVVAVEDKDHVISLPARMARVIGRNLRFEPQPHKNTVGYWSVQEDVAEWRFTVGQPGDYDVEIQQGCGSGHGGSNVQLQSGDQTLTFTVQETGHFQNFRWRHLGRIRLDAGAGQTLRLVPQSKPGGAVMDVREIRLIPVTADSHTLRRAAIDHDGSRADRRSVQSSRPNVLLVLADDLGTLDAGCYGSRDLFTPRMDGLAHGGLKFTQAYAHTVCCPARAMLLTGRHPQRSGITNWTQGRPDIEPGDRAINLPHAEVTLAEVFRDAGYRTGLFGKWHLGAATGADPTQQGFDQFFGFLGGFIDNDRHFFLHGQGYHDLYAGSTSSGIQRIQHPGEYFPTMAIEHMEEFLAHHIQQHAAQPFFVYLPLNLPHYPEQSLQRFAQFYSEHEMPRQSYGQAVSTTDDLLGMAMDALDQIGVRDNTIVLFTSDNGHSAESYVIRPEQHASGFPQGHNYGANGGGGNTGQWKGHKGTFYEGGLRVPALMQFPERLPAGRTIDLAVNLSDWMPTLLALCDVEAPRNVQLDGMNLTPVLIVEQPGQKSGEQAGGQRTEPIRRERVMHWQWQDGWAVRDGEWKLIGKGSAAIELVQLSGKQPETTNEIQKHPEIAQRLLEAHVEWLDEVSR